jgi:hypothetical protein
MLCDSRGGRRGSRHSGLNAASLDWETDVAQRLLDIIAPGHVLRHGQLHDSHPIAFLQQTLRCAALIGNFDRCFLIAEGIQGDAAEDLKGEVVLDAESIILPGCGVLLDPGLAAGVSGSIVMITR